MELDSVRRYLGQYIDAQTIPRAIKESALGIGPTPLPLNHSIAEVMIDTVAASRLNQIQNPARINAASKLKGSKRRRVTENTNNANTSEKYERSLAQKGRRLEGLDETIPWSTPSTKSQFGQFIAVPETTEPHWWHFIT